MRKNRRILLVCCNSISSCTATFEDLKKSFKEVEESIERFSIEIDNFKNTDKHQLPQKIKHRNKHKYHN